MKKTLLNMNFMLRYAWSKDKMYLLIRIPIAIISSLQPFIMIIYPARIIEAIMNSNSYERVYEYILTMVSLYFVSGILLLFLNKRLTVHYNAFEAVHAKVIGEKVMHISFPLTEDSEVLNLLERIKTIGYIEKSFEALFSFASRFITIAGLIWVLSNVGVYILITIVAVLLINIFLNRKLKHYNYQWEKEAAPYRRRNSYLLRIMYGFQYGKEIRLNDMEPYIVKKYDNHSREYLNKMKRVGDKYFSLNTLITIASTIQLLVVHISLTGNAIKGVITIAELTKFISAINSLTTSLIGFTNGFLEIRNNFNYVEDLISFFSLEEEKSKSRKELICRQNVEIEFRNVSFIYPNTTHYALENINVKISPKSKITIVGLNGSGKTTFIKLLLGLYKPTAGNIYINGIDINNYDETEYLRHFSCAFQDFRMFAYPIRENIVISQKYNESKLMSVINECGIKTVIDKLPLKADTPIYKFLDDTGVEFSGGETQKMAIARAIYKDSEVVILDEPLSSLDPLSEYNMYYNLYNLLRNRTCIFVSHRLSLARGADQIMVFDSGHLIESGTHDELMQNKKSRYAEMYNKQSSFYIAGNEGIRDERKEN